MLYVKYFTKFHRIYQSQNSIKVFVSIKFLIIEYISTEEMRISFPSQIKDLIEIDGRNVQNRAR